MFSRLSFALLTFLCLVPLHAQLDPRLAMSTDSMDVYKNPITVKPEIITLIDMSGSTACVTWHPNFVPVVSTFNDDRWYILSAVDGTSTITLKNSAGGTTFSVKSGATTYTNITLKLTIPSFTVIYRDENNNQSTAYSNAGFFVMPDGTPVDTWLSQATQSGQFYNSATSALIIDTASDTSPIRKNNTTLANNATCTLLPNHKYFALKSTHARITVGTKTVDVPIPWKIFDSPATANTYNASTSSKIDPVSTTSIQFDTRDGRTAVAGGQFSNSVFVYNKYYFDWLFTGTNIASSTGAGALTAWSNGIPALSRLQAIKRALLQTWMEVQTKVFWAIRAIDDGGDTATLNSNPTGTGRKVARLLLNNTSAAIAWLQGETSSGSTPLTYATAGAYAQMVDGSVFAAARASETVLNVCRQQFVIIFTDGQAKDSPKAGDPFKNSTYTPTTIPTDGSPVTYSGVATLKGNAAQLNSPNTYFNMWSLAGVAALGNNHNPGWTATKTSGTGTISAFAPFSVNSRDGGAAFAPHHPIETMTIGISLVGDAGVAGSSKNALLLTAGYGQAAQTSFDSANYIPHNAAAATGKTKVRFWDAQNASDLSQSLIDAIKSTMKPPPNTTSPVAPNVGMKAGEQVYFARYKAETSDAPLWGGDLLMVRTKISGSTVKLEGLNGVDLSNTSIDASNAIWAGSNVLLGMAWNSRKVYTYFETLSGTSSTGNRFTNLNQDLTATSCSYSTSNTNLLKYMTGKSSPTTAETDAQKPKIEWMRGNGKLPAMIMGDVINSSPVSMEYAASDSNLGALGLSSPPSGSKNIHLRLVFVGSNHGFFHAFAEVSWFDTSEVLQASATEAWAFVPKEFLSGAYERLNGAEGTGHVYMVDGPAAAYLNENTSTSGFIGKVDSANDKALVVFGLGKGGRSLYALDVSSPAAPKLIWALRPDDETDANANPTIKSMGMSTGMPDIARVYTAGAFTDLALVPGGLSTDTIDTAFATKLGRSVQAINITNGAPVQAWDFVNNTVLAGKYPSMGSVAASPLAIEVLTGTNLAQRVYFSDRLGGVYAIGCGKQQAATGANPGFRIDSSDPVQWVDDGGNLSVRKLFQASTGEYITTSPVPFRLNTGYMGKAIADKNQPQAVGVALGTGDFWDPMDRDAANPASSATNEYHRLVVLFDRNDSATKGYDSAGITPISDQTTPSANYLDSNDGYFIGFGRKDKPAGTPASETAGGVSNFFYDKIISEPLVFRGALYFNLFSPKVEISDGTCSGVSTTTTYKIADVMRPTYTTSVVSGTGSGELFVFAGIAGKLTVLGSDLVGVAGNMTKDRGTSVAGKGNITVGTDLNKITGPAVRLKSWRIVR